MPQDFIHNGQAIGDVASVLMQNEFDVGSLRPFVGQDAKSYVSLTRNGKQESVPLTNATATLRYEDWKIIDDVVVKAATQRLKLVADLRSRGLAYTIPNGMGKTVLSTETVSDITAATISMDGLRESQADRPLFEITNLPLPITHKDFHFSARQVMASRNGGSPLDTTTAELAARRVAEMIEQLTLGLTAPGSYTYGGGTVYGLRNYTNRLTKTITDPTSSGWTGGTAVNEVLAMRLQSQEAYHFGPWMIYCSPSWDVYMDDDYSSSKGDNTLRDRLEKINGIEAVTTLDYLTSYDLLMVQMTTDVIRMVNGMDITTVQWESQGGMQMNFKVMAILVPQIRADQNSRTGIVHGSI